MIERVGKTLLVADGLCDLVLNRHGYLDVAEIRRVLGPGGLLLTQQVDADNDVEFNEALGLPPEVDLVATTGSVTLASTVGDLESAGFTIADAREAVTVTRYLDIAAVIFQLRAVAWQAPGFDARTHREQLRVIHDQLTVTGGFEVRSRRFLIQVRAST